MGRSLGDAEDARLIEDRVEHARLAEPLLQAVRDVVDAALAPDVLAEDEQLGATEQLVCQRGVHRAGQRAAGGCAGRLGQDGAERRGPLVGRGDRDRGTHGHALRVVGRQRRDHLLGRLQPRPAGRLLGHGEHPVARLAHKVPEHLGVRGSRLQQPARVSQERVARLDGLDLRERAVRLLGVAAGVAPETHGAKVEERGPPASDARARWPCRRRSRPRRSHRPPGSSQVRLRSERVRDPAMGGGHADAGLVVLADQQQWHRQAQPRRVAGGVDGRERGRVVRACVAERAGDDGVGGQAVATPRRFARDRLNARPIAFGR